MTMVYSVLLGRHLWSSARPYIEMERAADNTSSIAPAMPQGCIDWLSTNPINNYPFPDLNIAPIVMATVTYLQFGTCTYVLVDRFRAYRKNGRYAAFQHIWDQRGPTFKVLYLSATATLATLFLPVVITGIWVLITVVFKNGVITMTYT